MILDFNQELNEGNQQGGGNIPPAGGNYYH
jgi:hypothetical protein